MILIQASGEDTQLQLFKKVQIVGGERHLVAE